MSNNEGQTDDNRPVEIDGLVKTIAEYVMAPPPPSDEAMSVARLCLMDSIGCAMAAMAHEQCTAHLGPVVEGAGMESGARVICTGDSLDPVKAAFDNGALIRWLDYNDTWLAAEWGHPSDNLGGLLAVADFLCRNPGALGVMKKVEAKVGIAADGWPAWSVDSKGQVLVEDLLRFSIQAHEIQGVLALDNSFNSVGLDHVMLVKIATAGLAAKMMGGSLPEVSSAISHAWIDGQSLRTYRHAPNTSQRKSWAAGDATSRGVRLALMATQAGLAALPSAVSAPVWGFADVLFRGNEPTLARKLGCYVMENILFKVSFPAEFHAQTAAECAVGLHPKVKDRIADISSIKLRTQESAVRIISKTGELRNFADRDHCLQYIVAVGLMEGEIKAEHYQDDYASNPDIDRLRSLMVVEEDPRYSKEYLDPEKRSIANAVNVVFNDGSETGEIEIEYPLGHRRRRDEARPVLFDKFREATTEVIGEERAAGLEEIFKDGEQLAGMPVSELVDLSCQC